MNDLHFGLCVGIDRYPGFPGRDLSSATRDALAFRDWLVSPTGGALPPANVTVVTVPDTLLFGDVLEARPKMDEVLLALDSINERVRSHLAVNPQDWGRSRVYIYAAGHGLATPNGEGAVLMANAKPKVLGFNIDPSLYAQWYLECGLVQEVVVLVDCCREVSAGMPPGFVVFQQCPRPARDGTVRFIAYASRHAGQAWEPIDVPDPDLARGYFTEALIDGLNGAAAEVATGQVTAASLATYVAQAVEEKTKPPIAPYPQRVEMLVDMAVRLVLRDAPAAEAPVVPETAAPATARHTATIRFPAGFEGEVVVRSSDGAIHGRWRATDGDWRITLPDSFYKVVPESPAAAFQGQGLFELVGADADVRL